MKLLFTTFIFILLSLQITAQNNYIVKTDNGRRVLLKADYTWEYIDLITPEKNQNSSLEVKTKTQKNSSNNVCELSPDFSEPKLNIKTQALLKRSRSSIEQLKKKVAKKEGCDPQDILLISAQETKAKGTYTFCTCKGKKAYKRNGSSFFKKGKLF